MSTNPFEERRSAAAAIPAPTGGSSRSLSRGRRRNEGEPAIWAARNVEWPIPSSLSLSNYQKLLRASKQAGSQLGIVSSALDAAAMDFHKDGDGGDCGAAADAQNYYGLSGFMSRVLNTSGATMEKPDDDLLDPDVGGDSKRGSKPLRPPRNGCVATANGWIVAALECPSPTTGALPLRLVSRWNVRRGSSADQWTALPPPVGGDGRIMHVFVDPTGCHTLLSARNGEAYYLHSSSRLTQKLLGFGKNPDGSLPKDLTGVAATSVVRSSNESAHVASIIQEGCTVGSYITAVAWDRERGTEGSTKRIILGTSLGELYEYALVSPNSEGTDDSVPHPILLHKLHLNEVDPTEMAAAVTGIFFERWRVGMLILVATSGRHKRTRFHTFYSPSDTAFRLVLANQQHSTLVELPGSVDFADLRLCNDNFALRTATGIYYGSFDRSQTGAALLSTGSGAVAESGILPYDTGKQSGGSGGISIPVSIALTPHHLITLYESNEVRFINRVAHKVIQKEKVDWVGATPGTAILDESAMGLGELLTDIRRPEQVWMRKSRALIHISSSQEDRDVWKYTLEKCLAIPSKPSAASSQLASAMVSSLSGPVPVLSEEEKVQEALFEHAKSLCTNSVQKSVVTAVRAEYHLSQGRAELAAKYLAQCPPVLEPFADTSIRLALPMLGIDDPTSYGGSVKAKKSLASSNLPLITYLSNKMRVARMSDDNVTCTMIGAWLTELHLHERERTAMGGRGAKTLERSQQALLAQLLTNHVNSMDSKTIMRILSSHDVSAYECASYASASGDIATAVNAALSHGSANTSGALEALRILNSSAFEIAEPLYYKHAPTFLERAPTAAAQSFLSKYGQGLSPTKLLPSFMHYEQLRTEKARARDAALAEQNIGGVEETKETNNIDDIKIVGSRSYSDEVEMHLRPGSSKVGFIDDPAASTSYFEGVVKMGCRSNAVFSYLISLYVKMVDEEPLFRFLTTHVPAAASFEESVKKALLAGDRSRVKGDELSFPLDLSYTLRSVLNSGRHYRSAVKLYTALGMLQQAVELALKVDPSLARELAQESVDVDERRRLWLMIARSAATDNARGGGDVVSKVVSVLKDCGPDVLSIEDVLPFLPDFTQIDQIKDEICSALMSYASKIEGYLKEMNECDQTCDALREEIMRLSTHRMEMKTDARCALTKKLVLGAKEPFYVFPSGYVILESPLKNEVLPHLNPKQRARVKEIELLLQQQKDADARELLQAELDGLIGAECPLTGLVAVENIDRGFEGTEFDDALLDRRYGDGAGKSDRPKMKANV